MYEVKSLEWSKCGDGFMVFDPFLSGILGHEKSKTLDEAKTIAQTHFSAFIRKSLKEPTDV